MSEVIRGMEIDDLVGVMAIAASLMTAPQWPREVYKAAIAGDGPKRIALVAEDAGEVVGFAVAAAVLEQVELESIAVVAEAQRRGVGALLLRELIGTVRGAGATELVLEVRASNQAALGLYARGGFAVTGRRRGYYANPVEDAVLLRLQLAG